jgi:hypothetical protein
MADTYLGIGKLNLILFMVVYFMIVGVVATIFNSAEDNTVLSDSSLSEGADSSWDRSTNLQQGKTVNVEKPSNNWWDSAGKAIRILTSGVAIFWAGITFDLGDEFPLLLRLFLSVPVVLLFLVVVIDTIIEVLKAVFKVPFSG